jgi:catechol 2,3-dioxygenase-like lactoylglutathione lyase family enzyme
MGGKAMSGFDHVGLSVVDYAISIKFYEQALAPLGIKVMMTFDNDGGKISGLGSEAPFFWVGDGGKLGGRLHLAFEAQSHAEVDAFYAAAIAAGGKDNGGPGIREMYHPTYYAAYVYDPDGHNIEAVCHVPA